MGRILSCRNQILFSWISYQDGCGEDFLGAVQDYNWLLRAYSWQCLWDPLGFQGLNLCWPHARQMLYSILGRTLNKGAPGYAWGWWSEIIQKERHPWGRAGRRGNGEQLAWCWDTPYWAGVGSNDNSQDQLDNFLSALIPSSLVLSTLKFGAFFPRIFPPLHTLLINPTEIYQNSLLDPGGIPGQESHWSLRQQTNQVSPRLQTSA